MARVARPSRLSALAKSYQLGTLSIQPAYFYDYGRALWRRRPDPARRFGVRRQAVCLLRLSGVGKTLCSLWRRNSFATSGGLVKALILFRRGPNLQLCPRSEHVATTSSGHGCVLTDSASC